jgi:hypothetical protein
MTFVAIAEDGAITSEQAKRIATLANGILDLCLEHDGQSWEAACALTNVLGVLICGGAADESGREGRLGDVVKNLRTCTRQSRSH